MIMFMAVSLVKTVLWFLISHWAGIALVLALMVVWFIWYTAFRGD